MDNHAGEDLDLSGPSLRPQWNLDRDKKKPVAVQVSSAPGQVPRQAHQCQLSCSAGHGAAAPDLLPLGAGSWRAGWCDRG